MKVATLTLPLHTNYGGVMQAYALQNVLKELGHTTELLHIELASNRPFYRVILSKFKAYFTKICSGGKYLGPHRNLGFETFIKNEINRTEKIVSTSQLNSQNTINFDAFIVGSDQVWRPDYALHIERYFFDFVQGNKKIISYAASFGGDIWGYDKQQTEVCKSLAKRFTAISVREDAGVDMCKKHLEVTATRLLDPTLLLDITYYERLIEKYNLKNVPDSGKLFSYILDINDSKANLALEIGNILGIDVTIFNQGYKVPDKLNFGEWLKGFKDSKFVFTDSFHGVAFSIIFNKPFIAIGNKARGLSRFETILDVFNLKNRLFIEGEGNIQDLLKNDIDYNEVNTILLAEKERSIEFIKSSLSSDNLESK